MTDIKKTIYTLTRYYSKSKYTIGKITHSTRYICDTLEPSKYDRQHPCIPVGRYRVVYTYSPKFKKEMPLLLNVPHRSYIRIHTGNTVKDTDGCIIVGENKVKGMVINSKTCFDKLDKEMKKYIASDTLVYLEVKEG